MNKNIKKYGKILNNFIIFYKPYEVYIENSNNEFYLRFENKQGNTIKEFPLGNKILKEFKHIEIRTLN